MARGVGERLIECRENYDVWAKFEMVYVMGRPRFLVIRRYYVDEENYPTADREVLRIDADLVPNFFRGVGGE